jgi:hypothetical protein
MQTKVDIITIDYITGGRFQRDHPILDIPVELKLACGQALWFEGGRELSAYLRRVDHQYDSFRNKFTVVCEECIHCDVGRKLRLHREEAERDKKAFPYRTNEGLIFFPDTGPTKTRKR